MRRFVAGLIYAAMLKVYESEKESIKLLIANIQIPAQTQFKIPKKKEQPEEEDAEMQDEHEVNTVEWPLLPDVSKASVIINFINACMNQLDKSRKFTANFEHYFNVISRFLFLGPLAREYAIKSGMFKHLLAFYLQRDDLGWMQLEHLNFKAGDQELGGLIEIDDTFSSPFEAYIAKRREQQLENANPNYQFLLQSFSFILRSCVFEGLDEEEKKSDEELSSQEGLSTKTGFALFPVNLKVDKIEYNLLGDIKNLRTMIEDGKSKLGGKEVAKMFAHMSYGNKKLSVDILKGVMEGINLKDYDELRPYYTVFNALLDLTDNLSASRMNVLNQHLHQHIANNLLYYKYMETSIDQILKV